MFSLSRPCKRITASFKTMMVIMHMLNLAVRCHDMQILRRFFKVVGTGAAHLLGRQKSSLVNSRKWCY